MKEASLFVCRKGKAPMRLSPRGACRRYISTKRKRHDLSDLSYKLLLALADGGVELTLRKGRMRPVAVRLVGVSCADRVRVRRLDNGREYWAYAHHIQELECSF